MAFRQTPTEDELNPILPTMPGYKYSEHATYVSRSVCTHLSDHPNGRLSSTPDGHKREVLPYGHPPVPVLREHPLPRRPEPPSKRGTAVVPLPKRNLAARIQRDDIEEPDVTSTDAIGDSAHFLEKVWA